jgi:junctophilin
LHTLSYRYEGEWFANKKYGYGVTTFRDTSKEEGKYKNNVLITSQKKKHLFLIRSAKFRERIDAAVDSAQRASKYAMQKADIAISRTATARGKAESADVASDHARVDSEVAIQTAREFAPDFKPALLERFERIRVRERFRNTTVNDEQTANINNKSKLLQENQLTPNQTPVANSIASPNKQTSMSNNLNQQQQQQLQQQQMQQQKQNHNLLNPQPTIRRTSVNPSMIRQTSIDYSSQNNMMYANKTSNSVDYSNTLGLNQQFSQPQPPGNSSAFSTPQKLSQNVNSMQPTTNVSIQQSQHNQMYQSSASHYQENTMNSYNYQQQQQPQQQQQQNYSQSGYGDQSGYEQRRASRQTSESGRPMLGAIHQTSIDHFDHYKRPPSRDSSVDRYTRAASRMGASRQPSVDRQMMNQNPSTNVNLTPEITIDRGSRAGSQMRGTTPAPPSNINGSVLTGVIGSNSASRRGSRSGTPVFQQPAQPTIQQIQAHYSSPNQPFEDVLLRQRTLGQDIIPSPGQPKRTESLFIPVKPIVSSGGGGGGGGSKGATKVSVSLLHS